MDGYSEIIIPVELITDTKMTGSFTFLDLSNHQGLNIDRKGCESLLNPEKSKGKLCVTCNRHERRSRKTICKKCPFSFNSASTAGAGSRVGCGAIFSKYGIIDPGNVGKCWFFYFMYYPDLQFKFPDLPFRDYLGNYNKFKIPFNILDERIKQFRWIMHHWNGLDWDDRVWNLMLVLNTEHGYIHGLLNREYEPWNLIQENSF